LLRLTTAEGDEVAHVEWIEGEVSETLDDLLREPVEREMSEADKREAAVAFLAELLVDGPRPTREIEAKAAERGISTRTLWRARNKLRIESHKTGFEGEWFLRMPGRSDSQAFNTAGVVGGDRQSPSPTGTLPKDANGRDHQSRSERVTSAKSANSATNDGAPQHRGVQAFERQLRLVDAPDRELAAVRGLDRSCVPRRAPSRCPPQGTATVSDAPAS
jgi:hypothetical protein